MNYNDLQLFFNHHCKIRLRSGKEVFGVLWEELNEADKAIYFASYIEHKKQLTEAKNTADKKKRLLELKPDDILRIETVTD
ncbi:MAG: hypothetical protein ABR574_00035 [Cryomorphaceae bacterium]|nr:hypothetical protein [Flavobacteriales bacterium]